MYGLATVIYICFFARTRELRSSALSACSEIGRNSLAALSQLMVPIIIIGIYCGVFTSTEAAEISDAYALFVYVSVHREITLKTLFDVCLRSAGTCAQVMILVAAATSFAWLLTVARIP